MTDTEIISVEQAAERVRSQASQNAAAMMGSEALPDDKAEAELREASE